MQPQQIFCALFPLLFSEDNTSSSQVSDTVPPAVGGHHNKPNDPSAVSADDRPDVELYGPVFSQC